MLTNLVSTSYCLVLLFLSIFSNGFTNIKVKLFYLVLLYSMQIILLTDCMGKIFSHCKPYV